MTLAWGHVYELETNYYHPALLEDFAKRYPDYPNKAQLSSDLKLSKLQLYPFSDSSISANAYGYKNDEMDDPYSG